MHLDEPGHKDGSHALCYLWLVVFTEALGADLHRLLESLQVLSARHKLLHFMHLLA